MACRASAAALFWMAAGAAAPAPDAALTIGVTGLRSQHGMLMICLTRLPDHFPDCAGDPDRRHYVVPVSEAGGVRIGALPPGDYALALIHDENGNRRLDTFAGIPREGVGFSENPPLRFGPPSFRSARFAVGDVAIWQQVRIKYFL